MPKKYFIIVDTETTQTNKVADLGLVVCDKQGNVEYSAGFLVSGVYDKPEKHPLFYTRDASPLWGMAALPSRYRAYNEMLQNGQRTLATIPAINATLAQVMAKYRPTLTAYNLAFDLDKCTRTGIDLKIFQSQFCLWHASAAKWAATREFRAFVLNSGAFNPPTAKGNLSYKSDAEIMARFVTCNPQMPDEPHTALEDALLYELPILTRLVKASKVKDYMNARPYNWRHYQVRDHYKPV